VVTIAMVCLTDGGQKPIMASLEGKTTRKFRPLNFSF
jgi:hypothetical protein